MINRLRFLKSLGHFNFRADRLPDLENFLTRQVDVYKLETVICLESVMEACYQNLAGLVQDQDIHKEYQRFEHHAQHHQVELRRIFPLPPESETAVANKVYECLMQVKSPYLFLRGVIDLAISITSYKIDIYEYFFRTNREHHELLNDFVEDSIEEMNFLRQARKFHQMNGFSSQWAKIS